MTNSVHIDWRYSGRADGLTGAGAPVGERGLAYGFAAFATIALVGFLRLGDNPIAYGWRLPLLALFVFDIAGGAVANMLNSCKRFYNAPRQPQETGFVRWVKRPFVFSATHIHPILAAWAFGSELWIGVFWYIALVAGVAATLAAPLYLRRPIATAIVVTASGVSAYGLGLGAGLEWFIPCLFFKIVLAHTVREEPYRPQPTD
ncbi:MAG: hypothetical protein ACFB2Z_06035 [Maricaulaceae bacterium]